MGGDVCDHPQEEIAMEILGLTEVGRRIGRKPATIRAWTRPGMERFRADLLVKRHTGGRYYSTPGRCRGVARRD